MSEVRAIPERLTNVTAHLVVQGAAEAIAFYEKAFGAVEIMRAITPDGARIMHAEIRIGSAHVFLADDFPEYAGGQKRDPKSLGGSPVTLHVFTEDCDALHAQAVAAGATSMMPPMDMFWGDRYAKVVDPFGHDWAIATHVRDVSPEEMAEAAATAFAGPPES